MIVIQFPGKCEECGRQLPNCDCVKYGTNPLWEAVKKIDLSKKWKLDEFITELKRILNEK